MLSVKPKKGRPELTGRPKGLLITAPYPPFASVNQQYECLVTQTIHQLLLIIEQLTIDDIIIESKTVEQNAT